MPLTWAPFIVFVLTAVLAVPSHADDDKRVALVIGNAAYGSGAALANPINDAEAVAATLEKIGFDSVQLAVDATRFDLESALDQFSKTARGSDMALIYYAGHGIQIESENYILPVDVIPETRRDIQKLVPMKELLAEVGQASRLGVIVLDACRNNPFIANLGGVVGRGLVRKGLAFPETGANNTLIAYATESNAVALDALPGSRHSPYTSALLQHMEEPNLDIRLMLGRVRDTVLEQTDGGQKPFFYGSVGGDRLMLNAQGSSSVQASNTNATRNSVPQPEIPKISSSPYSTLTVKADPADAIIRIMNIKDKYQPGMRLSKGGSYDLFVTKKGHKGIRRTVTLEKDHELIELTLVPRSGAGSSSASSTSASGKPAGGVVVSTTGVASYDASSGNVEVARTRAINNAVEVAILRVAGVLVSGEKTNISRMSDSVIATDNVVEERLKQDSVFHNTVVARSNGFAKLVAIEEEGQSEGLYKVKATVEVGTEKLEQQMKNAGVFWERVGSPEVFISLQRTNNGTKTKDSYTLEFLRDTLGRNGIKVSTDTTSSAYLVNAKLSVSTKHVTEFDTYTGSCSMSYEIVDGGNQTSIGAFRRGADSVPGFSRGESASACARKIVPTVAKNLVQRLTVEFNDVFNKGRLFELSILGISGGDVTQTANLIRNIFRVTNLTGIKFNGKTASMDVQFKGQPFEFVEAVTKTLEYEDLGVSLESMEENKIALRMF